MYTGIGHGMEQGPDGPRRRNWSRRCYHVTVQLGREVPWGLVARFSEGRKASKRHPAGMHGSGLLMRRRERHKDRTGVETVCLCRAGLLRRCTCTLLAAETNRQVKGGQPASSPRGIGSTQEQGR